MVERGLCTNFFAERAGFRTQSVLAGWMGGQIIRDEATAMIALGDYFDMVNDFNLSYSPYLEPQNPLLTGDVQIYTSPLAGLRVLVQPRRCHYGWHRADVESRTRRDQGSLGCYQLGYQKIRHSAPYKSFRRAICRLSLSISARRWSRNQGTSRGGETSGSSRPDIQRSHQG